MRLKFSILAALFLATFSQAKAQESSALYTNDKFHIAFEHASDLKIRFSARSENQGVITAVADPGLATVTLGINAPPVQLTSMQKTVSDENVTINGIPMRKRIIADPVIGSEHIELQEVIYDFTHKGNTFTWWGVFRKSDVRTPERMDRIIESFKFTD